MASSYFSMLSHKRHDFRKNITEHKTCVLIFSTSLFPNISHSKKSSARYHHKCSISVFMKGIRYSCQILMNLEFSRQIFEKYLNMKFHENPSSGSRASFLADRQDEADSC